MVSRFTFLSLVVLCVSCKPTFDERSSEIRGLRVLAVRSDPAEAPPGTEIQYSALAVDPLGPRPDALIDWAYCTKPKPASELNDTTFSCFFPGADWIKPFGSAGTTSKGTLPISGCNQFGPDIPDIPGQPPSRPADPDATGGYYQPVRMLIDVGGQYQLDFGETRLSCNLPGATGEVFTDYRKRYQKNENPEIDRVVAFTHAEPAGIDVPAEGLVVEQAEAVRLVVTWATCPETPVCRDGICTTGETADTCPDDCTTPRGCTGAEPYVYYDLATRTLLLRHEAMRVSWFATAGEFDEDRTGSAEEQYAITQSDDVWTAPAAPGLANIWIVLRDSRGGVSFRTLRVRTE